MKNEKKLTKGCEKDHSPPLEPPRLPRLVCIYPHHGVHISPANTSFLFFKLKNK